MSNLSIVSSPFCFDSIQHYVIKFVSDLRQVGGFLHVLSSTNKSDLQHITEILLKVALNSIILTLPLFLFSSWTYVDKMKDK
jgi:hypothetical protein